MREKQPAYNLINNNCQNFATLMLEKIKVGSHREFATAFTVYQKAVGFGKVKDLFVEDHPDDHPEQRPQTPPEGTVQLAEKIMDEKTTKIDDHKSFFTFDDSSWLSRFKRKGKKGDDDNNEKQEDEK
jgi:hypothetical protein